MAKMTKVRLRLAEVRPDPVQYKPYAPAFAPTELYLDVEVPAAYVDESKAEKVVVATHEGTEVRAAMVQVLSEDGFKYLLARLADLVQETHDQRLKDME